MDICWLDLYCVGNVKIDTQHQQLFALARVFSEAPDKIGQTACAMRLFQYTREHFGDEELLMLKVGFPDRALHIEQHNVLLAKLNAISLEIANGALKAKELELFLTDWLIGHIGAFDTKLAAYLQKD